MEGSAKSSPYPRGKKWLKADASVFICPQCDVELDINRSKLEFYYLVSLVLFCLAVFDNNRTGKV